ncbi:MAG: hypothetical protein B7Z08_13215 [Sphingomonadales bacterium 32-68-7]|nr:MAG: hypothetical protein B7Z33_02790 [Sphingomonadales bacterium 12-68-11]OYX06965.1 MAG: hypothetical protein B7Z08_13215 [Sphingomonadales bacterium 32-68-7]
MGLPFRLLLLPIAACAAPAAAELPAPVRAMIDAALATGDPAKIGAVLDIAKQTHPSDVAEIDRLHQAFLAQQSAAAEQARAQQQAAVRTASMLDNWSGNGQIGAFQSTGSSSNVGVSLALSLERTGVNWQHRLRANVDYQRSNGLTSREQYLVAWEPRIQLGQDLFAYSLAQYERDRFQGFTSRYSLSGGLGYKVLESSAAQLSVKAGPAWRKVDFVNGTGDSSLGALAGIDFDWQLARQLKFTQDADLVADTGGAATVLITSSTTSALLTSGLEAKFTDRLTTRVSYTVDYDSNPPAGAVSTDTWTRFSLVYGF